MRVLRLVPVLFAGGVAACASTGPSTSYVAPSLPAPVDSVSVVAGIASVAAQVIPPGSSVYLEPVEGKPDPKLASRLAYQLRLNGFTVADKPDGACRLRYWLTPLDDGELVRVMSGDTRRAAQMFALAPGGVQPGGPVTVEGGAS